MTDAETIPLQHNESYWLLDGELEKAYRSPGSEQYSTYPDYTELRSELAKYAGVSSEHLLVTAGSDSAIRMLAEMYAATGKRVLLPAPTFYGYERIFRTLGIEPVVLSYSEIDGQFIFPVADTLAEIADGADVVFLCQPNNPLGCLIPQAELDSILDAAKTSGATIVLDEAYFEFAGSTSISRIDAQPLIILRTMSKAFGLAGARVGYCIASTHTIQRMQERFLPWPVAHPSVWAALQGLRNLPHVRSRLATVIEAREAFVLGLKKISSVAVYSSETNFVLIRVADSEYVKTYMKNAGIFVARGDEMSGDDGARKILHSTIRMSVPAPWHMQRVLDSLSNAVENYRQISLAVVK